MAGRAINILMHTDQQRPTVRSPKLFFTPDRAAKIQNWWRPWENGSMRRRSDMECVRGDTLWFSASFPRQVAPFKIPACLS